MELYADIITPLALETLTYAVGSLNEGIVVPGSRVIVQVSTKFYTGIVWRVHNNRPEFKTKPIEKVVEAQACLPTQQIELFDWMSLYYMCPLGMVIKAALPSLLSIDGFSLEQMAAQNPRRKTITHFRLHPSIQNETQLSAKTQLLKRSPKQLEALTKYMTEGFDEDIDFETPTPIALNKIGVSRAIITQLTTKEILETLEIEVEQELSALPNLAALPCLTALQAQGLEQIETGFNDKNTVLFRGITGSGKTEIYIHLIFQALARGENVLFMIPEIALTTQLIERLEKYFGSRVLAYHSRYSGKDRAALYSRLLEAKEKGLLIVGVRSSIFLPIQNLGLVIVDEEHDSSYKQSDKDPNYHARDTALMMASIYKAKSLLGSATPSLESYYNTLSGKYGYVELEARYSGVEMPEIIVSDTRRASSRGERHDHINLLLKNKIEQALENGEQVMLFQNRRGFAPYVECGSCGYIPSCPDCSVSLTYHKSDNSLRCHYCGHTITLDQQCPKCSSYDMTTQGFGTQKIEEVLGAMFPEATTTRLDTDVASSKGRLQKTINSFKRGSVDILVGTQMITKGFDFGGVTLVGVLNADNMLHYPDFRAGERAYQTMVQVAGRAGRRNSRGQVIIQTSEPGNPVISAVRSGHYNTQADNLLREREMFAYPPFSRMIKITLKARERTNLWNAAGALATKLREIFGRRTLGPEAPPVERMHGNYNTIITIKIERRLPIARAKELIKQAAQENSATFKNVAVYFDVDPI